MQAAASKKWIYATPLSSMESIKVPQEYIDIVHRIISDHRKAVLKCIADDNSNLDYDQLLLKYVQSREEIKNRTLTTHFPISLFHASRSSDDKDFKGI